MLKFTFLVKRSAGMTQKAFIDYHRNHHAPLFISIPEAKQYVKKYVVSHPQTTEATHPQLVEHSKDPDYDAVTDIYFESIESFNNFFNSENYKHKIQPDEINFIDLANFKMLVCNELIVKESSPEEII